MSDIPFIFVHVGNDFFPEYINISIKQCRKWNPNNTIYVICDDKFFLNIVSSDVKLIDINKIHISDVRNIFINNSKLDLSFRHGFWRYTTERLFILYDFCISNNILEFIHLENDNMVYFSAEELYTIFRIKNGIASPALSKNENTFGILYCNNLEIYHDFLVFILLNNTGQNEMGLGSIFFHNNPTTCSFLPSIPQIDSTLSDMDKNIISNNIEYFNGVFDPAQYGQWLGGIDPRNGESAPFIFSNSCAIIQANNFEYEIKTHKNGHSYYIMKYKDIIYPIYLLHIHSKNLVNFFI